MDQGTALSNLTLVASDRFAGRNSSFVARVVLEATADIAHQLAVGGGGLNAPLELSIRPTAAPLVFITYPVNNTTVTNTAPVLLRAEASDDGHIRSMDFYLDNELLGSLTNAPYELLLPMPGRDHAPVADLALVVV